MKTIDHSVRPPVTVLLSVKDGSRFLSEAIESILGQTFTDFEFLIVNDGSTDASRQIASAYRDRRLRIIDNPRTIGLAKSLNRGIELSTGRYIARMDCDDVSLPRRLERQFSFMEANPHVGACGTAAVVIDELGKRVTERPVATGKALTARPWLTSPIIHASAIMRREHLVDVRYDEQLTAAQDFDLWFRLARRSVIENLPEPLLKYRVHSRSVSQERKVEQLRNSYAIFVRHTGLTKISYEEYLCLVYSSFKLNPIRHFQVMFRLSRLSRTSYCRYLKDSLAYSKLWLRNARRNSQHI